MSQITLTWKGFVIPFSLTAYGNLTEMCKAYGKRPAKFLERSDTIEYLAALAANTGLPLESDFNCPPGGQLELPAALLVTRRGRHESGTWAHPDITMECARWLSPDFSIACNRVIRGILSGRLYHPAIDKPEQLRMLAKIEDAKDCVSAQIYRYRQSQIVEGNQTTRDFLTEHNIELSLKDRALLGQRLGKYSRYKWCLVGHVWVRRPPCARQKSNGWMRVGTFPPEVIITELREILGIEVQPQLPPG